MKIIDKIASRERCAEAGWYAWDFILDQPMDDAFILSLRPLGSFVYLSIFLDQLHLSWSAPYPRCVGPFLPILDEKGH